MKFFKNLFQKKGKKEEAETLRKKVYDHFAENPSKPDIDMAISLLEKARELYPRQLGQYKSLAALYNMKCKTFVERSNTYKRRYLVDGNYGFSCDECIYGK